MDRYIEIFKNHLILKKQKLESQLEIVLNESILDLEVKLKKSERIIKKINDTSNVYTTFEAYINTIKRKDNGNT